MIVDRLTVENYRSIRNLSVPLERLNVFVGENGVGKTNLYRALELVQAAALGRLALELAAEGSMDSAFWAGSTKRNEQVRIRLGCELGENGCTDSYSGAGLFKHHVECGLPPPTGAGFMREPQIKEERLEHEMGKRSHLLLRRKNDFVEARNREGDLEGVDIDLLPSETAFAEIRDPGRFPDLGFVRDAIGGWRFHHAFRTDKQSPLRRPCLAVATPTLSADGSNLAAVFATLVHIREDAVDLDETIADAFPGAHLVVPMPESDARFGMMYREFPNRLFEAAELSDGTLKFLALTGALLGYRPANLIALNEPENSLHPDLLPALGRLIARAAAHSQIWVVTHSQILADTIAETTGAMSRRIYKDKGETKIEGLRLDGTYEEDEA